MKKQWIAFICSGCVVLATGGLVADETAPVVPSRLDESVEEELAGPFSYQAISNFQLGFKDSPEAMAATDGVLSSHYYQYRFFGGAENVPLKSRINTLEEGYIPILHFTQNANGTRWHAEMFSVPKGFDPVNNLVTFLKWTATNPGKEEKKERLKLDLLGLGKIEKVPFPELPYDSDKKRSRRLNGRIRTMWAQHNNYITGWWRDRWMDWDTFRWGTNLVIEDNRLCDNDHLLVLLPDMPCTAVSPKNRSLLFEFSLKPGEARSLVFKIPFVPVPMDKCEEVAFIRDSDYVHMKRDVIAYWKKELHKDAVFSIPEKKVENALKASLVNMLTARDVQQDGKSYVQKCNEFQYDWFYVRDNAFFSRIYDLVGFHRESRQTLNHYFYFKNGELIGFRKRTGIYQKLCYDYWGQILWAIGSHYRQNRDKELLELTYRLLPGYVDEFRKKTAGDPKGLWPKTWAYDAEKINGHYTAHSFWAVLGLRYAVLMAEDCGKPEDAREWRKLLDAYREVMERELERVTSNTGGYVPPGLDDVHDGYDWGNATAGVYPFEAVPKEMPFVRRTLDIMRKYNYSEGVTTHRGSPHAWMAKRSWLAGAPVQAERSIHQYKMFMVTESNLALGNQRAVIEDLYSFLVHCNSTHAGFEMGATEWAERFSGPFNLAPHGWCAARYIELIRNMLVREEGNDIYLLSAISPEWVKAGEKIEVRNAPTYGGKVNHLTAETKGSSMTVSLDADWNQCMGKLYIGTPWFMKGLRVKVDGGETATASVMEIPKTTKEIVFTWQSMDAPELSFEKAVKIYLQKYYHPTPTIDRNHLFPTLMPPARLKTEDASRVSLYSPDSYAPIYYTTDRSDPTAESARYTEPISIEGIRSIKAVCVDKDGTASDCLTLNLDD